jgi:serine/threonine-protein kinase
LFTPQVGMMITPNVRLTRPLSEGGMGAVWVADHLALRTQVVVKFILGELASNPDALSRFEREAAAASQVKSPHVVQTFDHGCTKEGLPYIVMELLEGEDLGDYLDRHRRMEPSVVLSLVSQLSRALDRAHSKGIVHRDIKPNNIFLTDGEAGEFFVKLLDFGIAKGVDSVTLDSATRTGTVMGSPFYMSPEQIVGAKDIGPKSDLWAVGVVAFEALTGVRPFEAETVGALAIQIHAGELPRPTEKNPSLPPTVDEWFARACAREIEGRYGSARELSDGLAAALAGQSPLVDSSATTSGPRPSMPNSAPTSAPVAATSDRTLASSAMFAKTHEVPSGSGSLASAPGVSTSTLATVPTGASRKVAAAAVGLGVLVVGLLGALALRGPATSATATAVSAAGPSAGSPTPGSPDAAGGGSVALAPTLVPLPTQAPGPSSPSTSAPAPAKSVAIKPHATTTATPSATVAPRPTATNNDPLL